MRRQIVETPFGESGKDGNLIIDNDKPIRSFKMERIYTALNAHEAEQVLAKGLVMKGVFGNTKKEIDENEVPRTLVSVLGKDVEKRFLCDNDEAYAFFQMTTVKEWTYLEDADRSQVIGMKVLLKDGLTIEEGYKSLLKLGRMSISLMDLFENFTNLDGSPIGKQKDASWKM